MNNILFLGRKEKREFIPILLFKIPKADADLIEGVADVDFHGLQDRTLYLILKNRFEKEISTFSVDFGKLAEEILAAELRGIGHKSRGAISLSKYFEVLKQEVIRCQEAKTRFIIQGEDGKNSEIDGAAHQYQSGI